MSHQQIKEGLTAFGTSQGSFGGGTTLVGAFVSIGKALHSIGQAQHQANLIAAAEQYMSVGKHNVAEKLLDQAVK